MSSRRIWLLGAVLVLATAMAQPARAEGDAKAVARAHFKRAEAAFNLGKFDDALAAYEAAYEAKPLPGFLFNIAQCHRNLGHHERALFFYRRYLALDPETPNRTVVEQLIDETEKRRQAQAPANAVTPPPAALAAPAAPAPPAPPPPMAPPAPAPSAPPVAAAEPAPAASSRLPDLPAARVAEKEAPPVFVQERPAPSSTDRPLYRRWGFWAVVGGVAVAGVTTAILLSRGQGSSRPSGELGSIDWR